MPPAEDRLDYGPSRRWDPEGRCNTARFHGKWWWHKEKSYKRECSAIALLCGRNDTVFPRVVGWQWFLLSSCCLSLFPNMSTMNMLPLNQTVIINTWKHLLLRDQCYGLWNSVKWNINFKHRLPLEKHSILHLLILRICVCYQITPGCLWM